MSSIHRLALLMIVTAVLGLSFAPKAQADWRRAESDRFIVYSDGRESALRDFVQTLETYDYIMRTRLGLPTDVLPDRKLPVYLVGGRRDLLKVHPGSGENVVGTYFPTQEDIFAVAIRGEGDDILLHEYAHHFMFQVSGGSYPGWLTEGFAEYFMTVDIKPERAVIGGYNANRVFWLQNSSWIPLEELLSKRPGEVRRGRYRETYYPLAWLLTHWFMGSDERRGMLVAYLKDVGNGGDPVEAMQRATGQSLSDLRRTLQSYFRGRVPLTRYEQDFPRAEMTVAVLPESANDLLLLGQRLKIGVPQEERAATAEDVRRAAADYPDDSFAQVQLGHAELHFGEPEAGEIVLKRLLEREPGNVEALQLLASHEARKARETDGDPTTHINTARRYLGQAYRADEANYLTYILLGELQSYGPEGPTENDVATWELAYQIAPQLPQTRLGYAQVLLRAGDAERAEALLIPLANAPHGGGGSDAAQKILERIRAGDTAISQADIDAAGENEPETPEPESGSPVLPQNDDTGSDDD